MDFCRNKMTFLVSLKNRNAGAPEANYRFSANSA
jgi:hypothetical protein